MGVEDMQTSAKGASLIAAATGIVDYAAAHGLIGWGDRVWGVNAVLEAVGATGPGPSDAWVLAEGPDSPAVTLGAVAEAPDDLLAELAEVAVANGCTADTASGRDRIAMRVMGLLMPKPSEVEAMSRSLLEKDGPRAATDWFYRTCCDAGYVRRTAIARNVCWNTQTDWGSMEITINLSKPEKDPREIAAAGKASAGEKYPACQLCIENEGYPGRGAADPMGAHPARQNLRIVPITLGGERWGLQYSPYAYFNEHCIAMSATHRPMHVDRASLSCLFDFVDLLPHYFIGSNADLPIVGGSILSHDHFQGGAHVFPMMRAATSARFSLAGFSEASGEILHWPLSVLRLSSANREQLLDACDHVVQVWHSWSDESVGVVARDADGTPHNTVTPIVRRVDGQGNVGGSIYEAYLALRCNVTSPEHPLGVFHPHEEWHHIKRENIGLIEVMGLAILPPRLVGELGRVEELLVAGAGEEQMADDPLASSHSAWAAKLAEENPGLSVANVHQVVRDGVGQVFSHVLEDAGVFKWDDAGRQAQMRFVASL
jgi:UDPglucose--hexose-1-phosphate uridylyltransferase